MNELKPDLAIRLRKQGVLAIQRNALKDQKTLLDAHAADDLQKVRALEMHISATENDIRTLDCYKMGQNLSLLEAELFVVDIEINALEAAAIAPLTSPT